MLKLVVLDSIELKMQRSEIYSFWKENWLETFKQLEGKEKVNSDDYFNAEKVVAVTFDDQPVTMAILNQFWVREEIFADLKYFNYYPPEVFGPLREKYHNLMACTYLTVHPDFRKSTKSFDISVPLSELIFALSVYLMRGSEAEGLLGVSRRDMGMTKMTKNYGAQICGIAQAHNVAVDLICVEKSSPVFNSEALNLIESILLPSQTMPTRPTSKPTLKKVA